MKKCPYCAEEILEAAIKCKHCNSMLDTGDANVKEKHGVPAILSLIIPGLGQLTKKQVGRGFTFFVMTVFGYACLIIPGIAVHLWSVMDAYNASTVRPPALAIGGGGTKLSNKTAMLILAAVIAVVLLIGVWAVKN